MYVPRPFAETDVARLHALMRAHPFATLVSAVAGVPFATHLPLLLDEARGPSGTLEGHVAGPNPHAEAFDGATPALAIFHGPHCYVSPRGYAGSPNVPTWNYVAVHAVGRPSRVSDAGRVRDLLARTAALFEAGAKEPWSLAEVPESWAAGMARAIVAFELPIDELHGKRKLSQNKTAADRDGVIAALRAAGDEQSLAVAAQMEALR
jgi:transcriptional regulator